MGRVLVGEQGLDEHAVGHLALQLHAEARLHAHVALRAAHHAPRDGAAPLNVNAGEGIEPGGVGTSLLHDHRRRVGRGTRVRGPAAIHLLEGERIRPVAGEQGVAGPEEVVPTHPQPPGSRLDPVLGRIEARRADPNRLAARQHKPA